VANFQGPTETNHNRPSASSQQSLGDLNFQAESSRDVLPETVRNEIQSWISARCEQVFLLADSPAELERTLRDLDKSFYETLQQDCSVKDTLSILPYVYQEARNQQTECKNRRFLELDQAVEARREILGNYVHEVWRDSARHLGRAANGLDTVSSHEKDWQKDRQVLQELVELGVCASDPERQQEKRAILEQKLSNQLRDLRIHSERRGEHEYLHADNEAQRLHKYLAGTGNSSQEIFSLLWKQSDEQRQVVFNCYIERYGRAFPDAFDAAYNTVSARVQHFFRVPDLKKAFEENFDPGAGLISFLTPSFRNWTEYKQQIADLSRFLYKEVKGPELSRIDALMKGDRVAAATESLFLCLRDKRDPIAFGESIYKKLSNEERSSVRQEFEQKYSKYFGSKNIDQIISDAYKSGLTDFRGKQKLRDDYLFSLLNGQEERADAISLNVKLFTKNKEQLVEYLRGLYDADPARLSGLKQEWRRHFGVPLDFEHLPKTLKGPLRVWADAILSGRQTDAAASRLAASLKHQTDEWVGDVFFERSEQNPQEIIAAYQRLFGEDFWDVMERRKGVERAGMMRTYLAEGKLPAAFMVRHCLPSIGADANGLKACLRVLGNGDLRQLTQDYNQKFQNYDFSKKNLQQALKTFYDTLDSPAPGKEEGLFTSLKKAFQAAKHEMLKPADLLQDLERKFCGHNLFDIRELLKGSTRNPHQLHERFIRRFKHELVIKDKDLFDEKGKPTTKALNLPELELKRRGDPAAKGLLKRIFSDNHPDTLRMLADAEKLNQFYKEKIQPGTATPQELRRYRILLQLANQSLDHYREHRLKLAKFWSNIGPMATVGSAFGAMFLFGVGYFNVIGGVFAVSYVTRYNIRSRLQGDGYGRRQKYICLTLASIDGVTSGLAKYAKALVGSIARSYIVRAAVAAPIKFAVKTALKHYSESAVARALLEDKTSGYARWAKDLKAVRILSGQDVDETRIRRLVLQEHRFDRLAPLETAFRDFTKWSSVK